MRVAHHRCSNAVHIFITRSDCQTARCLPESRIDDVYSAIAHNSRNQFDTTVMSIKAHLSKQNAWTMRKIGASIPLLNCGCWVGQSTRHQVSRGPESAVSPRLLLVSLPVSSPANSSAGFHLVPSSFQAPGSKRWAIRPMMR